MALKKLSFQIQPADAGKRLDQFLAEVLPTALGSAVSKGKVRKLVVAGAVYLNGKRIRIASKELLARARVEAFIDPAKLDRDSAARERQAPPFALQASDVLFEDEYLIAINKPPGLPTQPTLDEARVNLFAAVKKFLAGRDDRIDPYVGLHHRLDRDTSGVILFTKDKRANAGTAALFTEHRAVKTYWALTALPAPAREGDAEWQVKNFLGKAAEAGKRTRFTAVRSGGDFAHTDFKILERLIPALWVEARPRTGRTHQIRVHLAEGGLPILGDPVYGRGPTPEAARTMLHAAHLTFPHPVLNTQVSITAPPPKDFTQCLTLLQSRWLPPRDAGS